MKNVLRFLLSTFFTLSFLFGLGIFINPSIAFHFQIWVVILATIIMFSTQPKLDKMDIFNPNDKGSMLGISVMAIFVTNMTVIEWVLKTERNCTFNWINGIGFFMIWGGLAFRIYAIKTLKQYFSNAAEIQMDHQLFDKDIYAIIRHPSYTGAIITIIGTIVWLESWKTFPYSLILIALVYSYRIIQEEKMLTKHFGERYKIYSQQTGTLLPKLGLLKDELLKLIHKKSFLKK